MASFSNHTDIKALEEVIEMEIYPGTELMKDVGSHHFVKDTARSHSVVVPQPSNDQHDLLNWSPFWKFWTMFCATLVTLAQGLGPLSLTPMFGDYIETFDSGLKGVVEFVGISVLVLGFSNLFWVPIQSCFGRRLVLILSTLICMASCIWRAKSTSYQSFMGASALSGFGAGPSVALQPTVIADVIFLHDRGKYQTLYFAAYFGALTVSLSFQEFGIMLIQQIEPVIAGSMAKSLGWQSFWWLNVGILGFTSFVGILLFPETRYTRSNTLGFGDSSSSASQPTDLPRNDKPTNFNKHQVMDSESDSSENQVGAVSPVGSLKDATINFQKHPRLGRDKPSKQQWNFIQPYEGNFVAELMLPGKLFLFPIVEFAAFVVSWTGSAYLTVNLTQTQAFAAPPYNFDSSKIGLFNLATLVGTWIGLLSAGPLSDAIAARLTKRNGGIREPEMRLLAMIPYVILMIIGNVVVAVGYERSWDWRIIVIIGYTCIGIQVAALPAISSTYAIDSYKPVTGAISVMITINKNVWGYGLSSSSRHGS
ncbi:MFS general substrate transporter [Glarea lozoyensis ATCC 20868]|uniref:MFS general substrate transporter n=1 Tax=Glarea lozoyensis (strain ATCC 20868 / MF5171) TaxID=1116229 RepID=S3DLU0_GLAL2|nr:MFS general substrate transporter [Glarea lozoyensis ATCC 20868]EPE27503.1 MFS general substrate transporter [Glarea lozoyensis ATCC 20868]